MAKKKARPEMYWDERKELWRKRVKIDGKWSEVSGKTQEEVREKKREVERQQRAGLLINDQTLFGEYAQEWYKIKAAGIRPGSSKVYETNLNTNILPAIGHMRMRDIKPLHTQRLMAEKAYLARSTQSKILFTLSQIFESAIENNIVDKNPAAKMKAGGAPAKKKVPLSRIQQTELLSRVRGTRAELFVLLCLRAGLRREEALGLTWAAVHLGDIPYIEVSNAVSFDGNKPEFSPLLKSAAAHRSIPIPGDLASLLRTYKSSTKSTLVFTSANGKPMTQTAFRRMWDVVLNGLDTKKGRARANRYTPKKDRALIFNVEPHILRHTYITELCARGIDIKKVQYLAGHEDVKMTLNVYTHVRENTPQELAKILFFKDDEMELK